MTQPIKTTTQTHTPTAEPVRLLSTFARELGLAPVTLKKAAKRGEISVFRLGSRWYVTQSAVEAFLARCQAQTASDAT